MTLRPTRPLPFVLGAALALTLLAAAAQVPAPAAPASSAAHPSVSGSAPRARPAPRVAQAAPRIEPKPLWTELTPEQQKALAPLASSWGRLSEVHKRKWIALSQNFPTLPPAEQQRMHSRMAEWSALSPQQRTQARLNFAETQKVPDSEKKAKWEAYQALPPEEKRRLAAGATAAKPPTPTTAAALKPVPQQKLAKVPKVAAKEDARAPRIAVVPANKVDQNTLLPQPGALPAEP